MDKIFESIIDSAKVSSKIDVKVFLFCTLAAIVFGAILAFTYSLRNTQTSRNFVMTVAVLPTVVEVVVLLVNSLTTGLAIAGLFSIIRFRSINGNSREITNVLMSTVIGVTVGMGYIAYGLMFTVLIVIFNLLMSFTKIGMTEGATLKALRITVPESLDYEGIFDEILASYTTFNEVERIKTTNMGSMFQITYKIRLKKGVSEKKMIDEIRVLNGNLDIISTRYEMNEREML